MFWHTFSKSGLNSRNRVFEFMVDHGYSSITVLNIAVYSNEKLEKWQRHTWALRISKTQHAILENSLNREFHLRATFRIGYRRLCALRISEIRTPIPYLLPRFYPYRSSIHECVSTVLAISSNAIPQHLGAFYVLWKHHRISNPYCQNLRILQDTLWFEYRLFLRYYFIKLCYIYVFLCASRMYQYHVPITKVP